ncbi:MAG: peptidoglycan-binding domain-containing protein [bacterium]
MSISFIKSRKEKMKKILSTFSIFALIIVNFFGFDINTAHAAVGNCVATGGTMTTSGGYTIHTFTSNKNGGGGGGAGGYRSSVAGESSGGGSSAESVLTLGTGNHEISVGDGGGGGGSGGDVIIIYNNRPPVNNTVQSTDSSMSRELISAGIPTGFRFNKNYAIGSSNTDILYLQVFLNRAGFPVAKSGFGSKGLEKKRFGPATAAALAKFQKANNITPAVGYFGNKTRNIINSKI